VVEDRLQVAVVEAARRGGQIQRALNRLRADQRGEVGGAQHLGPDAPRPRGRGRDEPALGAGAELEELALLGRLRSRPRMQRVGGALGIMGRVDARVARRGERVARHLARTVAAGAGHHQLVAGDPDPDPLSDQGVRDRVAGRAEAQGGVVVDQPRLPEGDGVRLGRQGVKAARSAARRSTGG
jgi:hypothetical protein